MLHISQQLSNSTLELIKYLVANSGKLPSNIRIEKANRLSGDLSVDSFAMLILKLILKQIKYFLRKVFLLPKLKLNGYHRNSNKNMILQGILCFRFYFESETKSVDWME